MRVLAVDLGATTGKICVIEKHGCRLKHYELSRFATRGLTLLTKLRPILFWNLPRFFEEILKIASSEKILAVGIDAWGVDFGLFDAWGRLIVLPVHYRDPRTINIMNKLPISTENLFYKTGISPMPINSLFQLYAMVLQNDPVLNIARAFLMVPDIFNFWLTGEYFCEYTIATTSQCLSLQGSSWAYDILEAFNIPREIFPPVVKPGVIIGSNRYPELGEFKVVATAAHDTAAAVASIPLEKHALYISLGTWALIGVEVCEPILTLEAKEAGFTNEGGVEKINFHANRTGLWLIEECNHKWRLSYEEIVELAKKAPPFQVFFNPSDSKLLTPGQVTNAVEGYFKKQLQRKPKSVNEIARAIFENLILSYKHIIIKLEKITKTQYNTIYVVGGGTKNRLINQMLADATGKDVLLGPSDGASIGNGIVQFIALGELSNLCEGRRLVSQSFSWQSLSPRDTEVWEKAYKKWLQIAEIE